MGVPSRTSAPTPALDQTFDIQIILGKVRPFLRRLAEAHPQVLIIAPEIDDLNSTQLGAFEHAEELTAKREELSVLTAQLRMEAQSEAAQAAAAEAAQRLQHAGREPGWSLHLNPTPALIEQSGLPDADSYRAAQQFTEQRRAAEYRRELRGRDRGQDGLEL